MLLFIWCDEVEEHIYVFMPFLLNPQLARLYCTSKRYDE